MKKIVLIGLLSISWIVAAGEDVILPGGPDVP